MLEPDFSGDLYAAGVLPAPSISSASYVRLRCGWHGFGEGALLVGGSDTDLLIESVDLLVSVGADFVRGCGDGLGLGRT